MGDVQAGMALVFADRRRDGAYSDTDPSGEVIAQIRVRRGGARFLVEDAIGSPLCAGSTSRWGMSNVWRATGPAGNPLLELRKSTLRATAALRLAHGGEMVVEGSGWRRDFQV